MYISLLLALLALFPTYKFNFYALYINQMKMTEVSVETCLINLNVLSFSLKYLKDLSHGIAFHFAQFF